MKAPYAVLVYSAVALGLLSPMAPEDRFLLAPDHSNHVAVIHQAAAALGDGQFPIRSAPLAHGGVCYPLFQFYSPLPYTFAGLIHRYWFTGSAYLAYKLTLFLFLTAAGFAIRMAVLRLTRNSSASFVAGLAYLTMPYLIVNMQARGAFTETIGQCVAALVAWAVIELESKSSPRTIAAATAAWAALATTHLITFVYTVILFSVAALLLALWRRSVRSAVVFGLSLGGGVLLTAWYLFPVAAADYLAIRGSLPNPFVFSGFSPIDAVLLPYPTIPDAVRSGTPGFYSSAGLATLFGVVTCIAFARRFLRRGEGESPHAVVFSLLAVGWIFAVVSPFDFWQSLPAALSICQFPYRLLACVGLCGALCAGIAYAAIVRAESDKLFLGLASILLILSALPFRSPALAEGRTPKQVAADPDTGYGSRDYLIDNTKVAFAAFPGALPIPLLYGDQWMMHNIAVKIPIPASLRGGQAKVEFAGDIMPGLPSASISLLIDGSPAETRSLKPGFGTATFGFRVPAADSMTLELRSPDAVAPRDLDAKSQDPRKLAIRTGRIALRPDRAANRIEAPAGCRLSSLVFDCAVETPVEGWLTLPMFYYPDFLEVHVDGVGPAAYSAGPGEVGAQAMVHLGPGRHRVRATFTGSHVGNILSVLAALALLGLVVAPEVSKRI